MKFLEFMYVCVFSSSQMKKQKCSYNKTSKKQMVAGWFCGTVDKAVALNNSIPYGCHFTSQLLHFQSISLLMPWEQ